MGKLPQAMNILALTCAELAAEMSRRYGKGLHHARALYREVFQHGRTSPEEAPEFAEAQALARQLAAVLQWPSCRIVARREDDGVVKFISALADGRRVESVVIPARGRTTLCVSSQVGCRMGCRFCATGAMGFARNLAAEEIVWQVYAARFQLGRQIDNVVFMGMGEPLDNLDPVAQAVRVIADQRGLNIALRHVTLSTAGHADGIRRLAALDLPTLRLAVSLNATEDGLRSRLMPINRKYPLARLREELLAFPLGRRGTILIEYVLLAGVNDARTDAHNLAAYLKGLPVRVNVIAYNGGGSGNYAAPDAAQVRRFCHWLDEKHIFVRLRQSRGHGASAACGELGLLAPEAPE